MIILSLFLFVHSAPYVEPFSLSHEPILTEYGHFPFEVSDDMAKFYHKHAHMFTPQQNSQNPAMWNENSYKYNPMYGVQWVPGAGCSPYGPCPGRLPVRPPRSLSPYASYASPYASMIRRYYSRVTGHHYSQPRMYGNIRLSGQHTDAQPSSGEHSELYHSEAPEVEQAEVEQPEQPELEEGSVPLQLKESHLPIHGYMPGYLPGHGNGLKLSKTQQFGYPGGSPMQGGYPGPMPYHPYQPRRAQGAGAQGARNCLTSLGYTASDVLLQKYCSPLGKSKKALAVSSDCKSYGFGQNFYHQPAADDMARQYCQKQCRSNPACTGKCRVMASDDHVCKFLRNKANSNPANQQNNGMSPFGGGNNPSRGYNGGGYNPYGGYRGGGPFKAQR